jgi:hypothetical protein
MTAISVAIVGKSSEPLYVKQFFDEGSSHEADLLSEEELFGLPAPSENNNESSLSNSSSSSNNKQPNCSLRQQFILHAALDRFEQLDGPPPGFAWRVPGVMSGADAMFVGLLCPVEDMRVYGEYIRSELYTIFTNRRTARQQTLGARPRKNYPLGLISNLC